MDAAFKPLTAREVAALLACGPFAEAWSRGAALTLSGGDPLRLVYASPAALTMFGADSLEAVNSALHSGASPGARRLGDSLGGFPSAARRASNNSGSTGDACPSPVA